MKVPVNDQRVRAIQVHSYGIDILHHGMPMTVYGSSEYTCNDFFSSM